MAALTNFLRNKLLDHTLRDVVYTPPVSVWVGLFTTPTDETGAGTEVTGGSYARQQVTFAAAVGGFSGSSADIFFPTATAPWFNVLYFGIMDLAVGGNMLIFGHFDQAAFVNTGNTFFIPTGNLGVSLL